MNQLEHPLVINMLVYVDEITSGGRQLDFFEEIKNLGCNIVEVRREYFSSSEEMKETADKAASLDIELFYSIPDLLFKGEMLSCEELEKFFEEAKLLGATAMKFTAGYSEKITYEEVQCLNQLITSYEISQFTIENDQMKQYSHVTNMLNIFDQLSSHQANVGMTFDIGNFSYVDEDELSNYQVLKKYISFLHLKDVSKETKTTTYLGDGDVELAAIIGDFDKKLPLAIEYPCSGNIEKVLAEEIEKIMRMERK